MIKRTDEINSILIKMEERKRLINKARLEKIYSMRNNDYVSEVNRLERAFYLNAKKEDKKHKSLFWLGVCACVGLLVAYMEL